MEKILVQFEQISAIIEDNRNNVLHVKALKRIVYNFVINFWNCDEVNASQIKILATLLIRKIKKIENVE